MGMVVIFTCRLILVDTERWRRGEHLLHRVEASRALKKYLVVILDFLSLTFVKWKVEMQKKETLMGWLLILQLLRSGSQTVKWCLCWQMCFYPRTNLFAHSHKYVSHQLTNILCMVQQIYQLSLTNILQNNPANLFVWSDKYFHKMYKYSNSLDRLLAL